MPKLLDAIRGTTTDKTPAQTQQRSLSLDEWAQWFQFNGTSYPLGLNQTLQGSHEAIDHSFAGYANQLWRDNPAVFAVEDTRLRVLSEARFAWMRREQGRGQHLFTDRALGPLERPWPGGTTQDLIQQLVLAADLGGTGFATRNRRGDIRLLRPDWVTIVRGSNADDPDSDPDGIDASLVGFLYKPGGQLSEAPVEHLTPNEVAVFAPTPDPMNMFKGVSWLTPLIKEVSGDKQATDHKLRFFENGATPNLIVSLNASITPEQFGEFKDKMESQHAGSHNAYKTMYLGGGADPTVVGANLGDLDFTGLQGHAETRIANAAGIHSVVVGLRESMQGSSLNAGNYNAARRNTAEATFHPLWKKLAASLERIVPRQAGSNNRGAELVADTRDIPFLREDSEQVAKMQQAKAATINSLIQNGFTAESAIAAVMAEDFNQLEHSGLVSVQLQEPGQAGSVEDDDDEGLGGRAALPVGNGKVG